MIAQQLLNGVIVGSVYAMFALGLTLVFGIHKILNLAHGAVFMAGAFMGVGAVKSGLPIWFALPLAVVGAGLISVLIEVLAFRALRRKGESEFGPIVSSLGASLVVMSVAQYVSESTVMRFPFGTIDVEPMAFLGLKLNVLQVVVFLASASLIGALTYFIYSTRSGLRIRAVASNERAAALCGVNPNLIFFQTFFLAGALAGGAGVLVGLMFNSVHFVMGDSYMLRGFVVIVLGGLGSIPGALAAGLLLGVIQTITVAYFSSSFSDVIVFCLLFAVLTLRPNGLFRSASHNLMLKH